MHKMVWSMVTTLLLLSAGCRGSASEIDSTPSKDDTTLDSTSAEDSGSDIGRDDTSVVSDTSGSNDTSGCGTGLPASCTAISGDCRYITSNAPVACFDLLVLGSGFDAYEGQRARFVTDAMGVQDVADARIVDGAFNISMPQVLTDYTNISLFIDKDCSETCDPGEPMWGMTTSGANLFDIPYVIELTPDDLWPFDQPPREGLGGCFNNGFDLATRLPCLP